MNCFLLSAATYIKPSHLGVSAMRCLRARTAPGPQIKCVHLPGSMGPQLAPKRSLDRSISFSHAASSKRHAPPPVCVGAVPPAVAAAPALPTLEDVLDRCRAAVGEGLSGIKGGEVSAHWIRLSGINSRATGSLTFVARSQHQYV